jgi:F-type H+-transporting ATPase subunit gamma
LSDRQGCRVGLVVPTWYPADGIVPERRSLLPFDFRRFTLPMPGQPPLITLPPALLLARLVEEYVFAELCEAALTAFAAENEARVAAMLAAKQNLEHMGSDLRALERQIRQDEITAEVVELASGANVVRRSPSHRQ